jgi:hypothetical protein
MHLSLDHLSVEHIEHLEISISNRYFKIGPEFDDAGGGGRVLRGHVRLQEASQGLLWWIKRDLGGIT